MGNALFKDHLFLVVAPLLAFGARRIRLHVRAPFLDPGPQPCALRYVDHAKSVNLSLKIFLRAKRTHENVKISADSLLVLAPFLAEEEDVIVVDGRVANRLDGLAIIVVDREILGGGSVGHDVKRCLK